MPIVDSFKTLSRLDIGSRPGYFSLDAFQKTEKISVSGLPMVIKVLLEAALRNLDGFSITEDHVRAIARWSPDASDDVEIPFMPARVLLQDFTGVPALVDIAAMRSAVAKAGIDAARINPLLPVDLVIDHSVQVDAFGTTDSIKRNLDREYERNGERYSFIRWGQQAVKNFRVVTPNSGIVHQVNLEFLATCVQTREVEGRLLAFPDSLVGTDSHTTMINGLGILGWGVGGIEAEAVMLGQPLYMTLPRVVGVELKGKPGRGLTATDLVLTVTERLRKHGVVGKLVEFFGEGLDHLTLPDRATLANMAPEYGATSGFFPVDEETLRYLRLTGRSPESILLVEAYCRAQGLFRTASPVSYSETLTIDMREVVPSIAGPKRPQDRIPLSNARKAFIETLTQVYGKPAPEAHGVGDWTTEGGRPADPSAITGSRCDDVVCHLNVPVSGGAPVENFYLTHGSVVIAAITSCTNTSNPSVLMGAGLLARNAVERGISVKPWVKTSLTPGSRAVQRYLEASGLLPYLEALKFHVVGHGCATCIGNSGPLREPIAAAIRDHDLVSVSVLSGNRNFEGRVNPLVKANYLASPALVVAYAIAGTMNMDFMNDPLAHDPNGTPVYLRDIWPSDEEVGQVLTKVAPEMFSSEYALAFEGDAHWKAVEAPSGEIYRWDASSTYIQEPTFFDNLTGSAGEIGPIRAARVLAFLGDSVTTDHISPAGSIPKNSPAGQYLVAKGVEPEDFNSYGSRRGNHEVMMRGTFAHIRIRNRLAPGTEGGYTTYLPDGSVTSMYEASMRYQAEGVPLLVLAGKEYGTGSSRDWAAKGTTLLGIKAVIAESYERIHRSNLVGMGVMPLQFKPDENAETLGLTGKEIFVAVTAAGDAGSVTRFEVVARVDSPVDVRYIRNGGILQTVLREMIKA